MDSKLLCPTLSVMLVKTIKALCEINIHYDQKLEITGSLHVRSDGNKVLTCLLDEETVKGSHHETAARVAELAARLSLANAAAFTFPHVQPAVVAPVAPAAVASVAHSQQVAEALLSSMQGNTNVAATPTHSSHITSNNSVAEYGGYFLTPSVTAAAQSAVTSQLANADCSGLTLMRMSPISPTTSVGTDDSLQYKPGRFSAAIMPSSTSSIMRQKNGDIVDDAAPQKPGRRVDTVAKTLAAIKASNSLTSRNVADLGSLQSAISGATHLTADVAVAAINHIKLPDIQTLANRLPGFHSSAAAGSVIDIKPIIDSMSPSSSSVGTDTLVASTWVVPPVQHEKLVSSPSAAAASAVADVEVASDMSGAVDAGAGDSSSSAAPGKKKFQCMFCGIFLSTKCYLKNHINAVHTRSRIYQCDLCAHYFYSAGAARIHKLRNHWHNAKKHRCSECAETFLLPIELRKHIQKKHYGSAGYQLLMESGEGHQHVTNTSDASVDENNTTD